VGDVGDEAWLYSSIAQPVKGSKKRKRIFVYKKKRFGMGNEEYNKRGHQFDALLLTDNPSGCDKKTEDAG
jgi:hypothetical protein